MNTEYRRKIIHVILTTYPLFYYQSEDFRLIHIIVTLSLIVVWYISEVLRYCFHFHITPTYLLVKNKIQKDSDVSSVSIITPNWLLGYLIPALLFAPPHVINGVCVLSFGDTAAALFGEKGKRKSLRGSLAGFFVSVILCAHFSNSIPWAIGASFLGMVVEHFSTRVKDNYTVPFFASLGSYSVSLW